MGQESNKTCLLLRASYSYLKMNKWIVVLRRKKKLFNKSVMFSPSHQPVFPTFPTVLMSAVTFRGEPRITMRRSARGRSTRIEESVHDVHSTVNADNICDPNRTTVDEEFSKVCRWLVRNRKFDFVFGDMDMK